VRSASQIRAAAGVSIAGRRKFRAAISPAASAWRGFDEAIKRA
jgi:hypothetical protein